MNLPGVVRGEFHVIDVRYDAICPLCLVPSGMRADWVIVDSRTLAPVLRGSTCACRDCGHNWLEDP